MASWVRENMWTPEGDFDNGLRVNRDAYAYRNATFIYGAHMARQFDLSHRSMEHLLSWQDPATGGFSNNLEDDGMSDDMDIPYTVGPGWPVSPRGTWTRREGSTTTSSACMSSRTSCPTASTITCLERRAG